MRNLSELTAQDDVTRPLLQLFVETLNRDEDFGLVASILVNGKLTNLSVKAAMKSNKSSGYNKASGATGNIYNTSSQRYHYCEVIFIQSVIIEMIEQKRNQFRRVNSVRSGLKESALWKPKIVLAFIVVQRVIFLINVLDVLTQTVVIPDYRVVPLRFRFRFR